MYPYCFLCFVIIGGDGYMQNKTYINKLYNTIKTQGHFPFLG